MADQSTVALGTEYEKFVHGIYQALLLADGADTVDVRHNVLLKGNSGCEHQIDVYWEFRLAGRLYRTAIECKSFSTSVNVGRVRDFYGVLVDVPGLVGVFATKRGYQNGAKLFASHYGISLQEVREPTDEDWEGRVRKIHLNMNLVMPTITDFQPRPSKAYLETLEPNTELQVCSSFSSHAPIVFDRAGKPVTSYEELSQNLPHTSEAESDLSHFVAFPDHIFRTDDIEYEIEGIEIKYDVLVDKSESVIDGDALAKAIIKDVTSGERTFIDKRGHVNKSRY